MDWFNMNWKLLKFLQRSQEEYKYPELVNIGSCCLHNLGSVFKAQGGASWQNLSKMLRSVWKVLDESPGQRDIYLRSRKFKVIANDVLQYTMGGK